MKKFYSLALMALTMGLVFVSCDKDDDAKESYTLSYSLSKTDSAYISSDKTNLEGYYYKTELTVGQFNMVHAWGPWGFGGGFTYSSCTDDTSAINSNLSAITKKGVKSNTYFISYTGGEDFGLPAQITFKDGKAYTAKECYVTNATNAYLAITQGRAEAYVKQWTDQDKFTLTITGYKNSVKTNTVEFLLADGLNVVKTWQKVDLSKLGTVDMIQFSLSSTDGSVYNGITYMNTPAYFCLDQLTVTE